MSLLDPEDETMSELLHFLAACIRDPECTDARRGAVRAQLPSLRANLEAAHARFPNRADFRQALAVLVDVELAASDGN